MPFTTRGLLPHTCLLIALLTTCTPVLSQQHDPEITDDSVMLIHLGYNDLNICRLQKADSTIHCHAYDLTNLDADSDYISQPESIDELVCYQYNREDSVRLYNAIKSGRPLTKCYIECLDLNALAVQKNGKWIIPYTINISHSCIESIILPGEKEVLDESEMHFNEQPIVFTQPVTFHYCTFGYTIFNNVIFEKQVSFINTNLAGFFTLSFYNTLFKGPFQLFNDYPDQTIFTSDRRLNLLSKSRRYVEEKAEKIFSLFFKDNYTKERIWPRFLFSHSCRFEDTTSILNYNPFLRYDFSNAVFTGPTWLEHHYEDEKKPSILFSLFNNAPGAYTTPACNMNFSGSSFSKPVHLDNQLLKNVLFTDAGFADTLSLLNTFFKDSASFTAGFYASHFTPGLPVLVNPANFNLANLNINVAAINNLHIPYWPLQPSVVRYSETDLDNSTHFYERLMADVQVAYPHSPEVVSAFQNKYRHTQTLDNITYNWHHPSMKNLASWGWYSFLETTVGNGYNGGGNFLLCSVITILCFSLLLYLFHAREFVTYINLEYQKDKKDTSAEQAFNAKERVKNFSKCLWKSFIIFFNPKFDFKYFHFSHKLYRIIIIEWAMGIVMILLFVVYVATTYPFIRVLIGL